MAGSFCCGSGPCRERAVVPEKYPGPRREAAAPAERGPLPAPHPRARRAALHPHRAGVPAEHGRARAPSSVLGSARTFCALRPQPPRTKPSRRLTTSLCVQKSTFAWSSSVPARISRGGKRSRRQQTAVHLAWPEQARRPLGHPRRSFRFGRSAQVVALSSLRGQPGLARLYVAAAAAAASRCAPSLV